MSREERAQTGTCTAASITPGRPARCRGGEQEKRGRTHLSDIFKVVVSFLEGPGSVKGFPHAGVFAEEGFAVVLDPVYHLRETKQAGHRNGL